MAQFLYSTIISPAQFTVADNNSVLSLALGATTLVRCTMTQSIAFIGLIVPDGAVDGMVVTLQNIVGGSSFALSYTHNSGSAAVGTRFFCPGNTTLATGQGNGAATFRYFGDLSRWQCIARV